MLNNVKSGSFIIHSNMMQISLSRASSFGKNFAGQTSQQISCKHCSNSRIEKSRPKELEKPLVFFLVLDTYRCFGCYKRFWKPGRLFAYSFYFLVAALFLFAVYSIFFNSTSTYIDLTASNKEKINDESPTALGFSKTPILTLATAKPTVNTKLVPTLTTAIEPLSNSELLNSKSAYSEQMNSNPVNVEKSQEQTNQSQQPLEIQTNNSSDREITINQNTNIVTKPAALYTYKSRALQLKLSQLVDNWAFAWSEQDIAQFVDFYIPQYSPKTSVSHSAWMTNRKDNFASKKFISIEAQILKETFNAKQNIAEIILQQKYHSDTYRDTTLKKLTFVLLGSEWKIAKEESM